MIKTTIEIPEIGDGMSYMGEYTGRVEEWDLVLFDDLVWHILDNDGRSVAHGRYVSGGQITIDYWDLGPDDDVYDELVDRINYLMDLKGEW